MTALLHECAHRPCHCRIPTDHTYCCDHCSTQAALGQAQQACECEHAGCRAVLPGAQLQASRGSSRPELRRR
jgi:hypothetical protein